MSTEQKVIALRDEFEDHARYMALEGREVDLNWQTWKAAHAKYAPRWLPIDEAAKAGRKVDLLVTGGTRSYRVCDAVFSIDTWRDGDGHPLDEEEIPTHYMPIPDAPEVG